MWQQNISVATIVGMTLLSILQAAGIDNKANNVDRIQELHNHQEDLRAKLKHFENIFEKEIRKLTEKIEILQATVHEQEDLLRDCNACSRKARQSDDDQVSTEKIKENEIVFRKGTPDPKTCLEARTADPSLESGMFWIDPDGQGRGDDPIYVYCNMSTGSTSILHDSEDSIEVDHCFDPGCYSRQINYNATLRQITMLSELSNECHQTIKVDCFDAAFEFNGIAYAWWNDRNDEPRYFWSGTGSNNSSDHYHTCQCGLDGSCKDKNLSCNCDSDLAIELSDIGIIMATDLLPVTKLNFGRTIAPTSVNRHTLGRLECNGKVVLKGMPTSCQDLWRIGYILSGLYSIKGPSSKRVETVYCDFSKLPGDQGLQKWIGYADVQSTPVMFNVERNSSFNTVNTVMTFELETLNVGIAFNISTGVFTAPRSGTYFFVFSSISDFQYGSFAFNLQLNDLQISTCYNPIGVIYYCNIPYTLKLNSGDRIQVVLQQGSTNNANFVGWLLEEDIFES